MPKKIKKKPLPRKITRTVKSPKFTAKTGDYIVKTMAACTTPLFKLCETNMRFPKLSTLQYWSTIHEEFREKYKAAIKERAARVVYEGLDFLDRCDAGEGGGVGSARVKKADAQFKARVLIAQSMDSETWGVRNRHEVGGPDGGPIPLATFADVSKAARE